MRWSLFFGGVEQSEAEPLFWRSEAERSEASDARWSEARRDAAERNVDFSGFFLLREEVSMHFLIFGYSSMFAFLELIWHVVLLNIGLLLIFGRIVI